MILIELKNADLVLNNTKILSNINCIINTSDKIGVIGPNGSGKSTFLRLLAGIYKPSKGTIQINKYLLYYGSLGIGALPYLTVFENIKRLLFFRNINFKNINREKYENLINKYELINYLDKPFIYLSSGFKTRLYIVVFLLSNIENLILDEFVGFADKKTFNNFYDSMYEKNNTIIVASHNEKLVNQYCNRVIEFKNGHILQDYYTDYHG